MLRTPIDAIVRAFGTPTDGGSLTFWPEASGTPLGALGEAATGWVVDGCCLSIGATVVASGAADVLGRNGLPHPIGNNKAAPTRTTAVRRVKAGAFTPPGVGAA